MKGEDPRVARSRAAVLGAVVELLDEAGFRNVTIEAVSERSGVAKTTIYRHWPSRPQLLIDAYETLVEPVRTVDTGQLRDDVLAALSGLAYALARTTWARAFPGLIDEAERDPELARLAKQYVEKRRLGMLQRLERATRTGELPEDADVEVIAAALAGPLFYRRFITREPVAAPALLERLVDHALAPYTADRPG